MQTQFTVQDLHPATWYVMIVTAHSDAGSTDSELKFATLTYTGSEYREDGEGGISYIRLTCTGSEYSMAANPPEFFVIIRKSKLE